MKITVLTIGEVQLSFAKEGIQEYLKRINRFVSLELVSVKEGKKMEGQIQKHIEKKYLILLDEAGREYTSLELSTFLDMKMNIGKDLCFVIGGPDGHLDSLRNEADAFISLSKLTFPHDIASMLLLETLYRSFSILENHPYHRV